MKRGLLIGVGVIIVAILVGVYVLYTSLGGIIQAAVEKIGSEATQATVELDGVDLDVTSGKGALRGFTVGNPAGFKTPSAFKLGSISLHVDPATVTSDPVVIKEISIDKPEVTYELGATGSNVDAIKRNVDAYAKRFAGAKGEAKEGGEGPKVVIEHLYVRGGKVNVSAAILQGKAMGAPLPDIHLTDIGKDKGGASPAEVAKKVIDSMTANVGSAMSSIGVGKTLDSLKQTLGGAAGKATETMQKTGEEAAGKVEEGLGKAGESMKKLFGN
jgi:hypothetical protein